MQFDHLYQYGKTLIKIDLDRYNFTWYFLKGLKLLSQYYSIKKIIIKKSPSNKLHIVICIKEEMTDFEIVTWQFNLDSDKYRERMNLLRIMNKNPMKKWNLLFPNKINRKIKGTNLKIKAIAHHKKPLNWF